MSEKKYFWLKLKENFFNQKEIKKLRTIAGGDTFTIIYLKMQLKSLSDNGNLFFEGFENNFADELALEIDEKPENVMLTINYLLNHGLIIKIENNDEFDKYHIPAVNDNTGKETSTALRVRKYRENKKALHCNTSVTPMKQIVNGELDIEIDKELEIDKDIYIKHYHLKLTNDEYQKLCNDLSKYDVDNMINTITSHSKSYLKKYSSFYKLVQNWHRNNHNKKYNIKQSSTISNISGAVSMLTDSDIKQRKEAEEKYKDILPFIK